MPVSRRQFLRGTGLAAWSLAAPSDLLAQPSGASAAAGAWDPGVVRHVLPTVSDTRMLIKASFAAPLAETPILRVGGASVRGRMSDTRGEFWQFHATDLAAGRSYQLALVDSNGRRPVPAVGARDFPRPRRTPGAIPPAVSLLRRRSRGDEISAAGRAEPVAAPRAQLPAAGGDRQRRPRVLGSAVAADVEAARRARRKPSRWPASSTAPAWFSAATTRPCSSEPAGTADRRCLRRRIPFHAGASSFRTTTTISTTTKRPTRSSPFRPRISCCSSRAPRSSMFYPEFLPDVGRPRGLPWSSAARPASTALSETFGTIRYGRLAEVLLYDIRRTLTLAGPSAVYVDREAERVADVPNGGDRGDACRARAVQSAGLDRRKMGRVVSRHRRCRTRS